MLLLGTYKLRKRTLQAEAFSIRHVKDPIFFLDNKLGQYVPLTIQLHDDIVKGTGYIYNRTVRSYNLFVTSKNETMNSPIYKFKVLKNVFKMKKYVLECLLK